MNGGKRKGTGRSYDEPHFLFCIILDKALLLVLLDEERFCCLSLMLAVFTYTHILILKLNGGQFVFIF